MPYNYIMSVCFGLKLSRVKRKSAMALTQPTHLVLYLMTSGRIFFFSCISWRHEGPYYFLVFSWRQEGPYYFLVFFMTSGRVIFFSCLFSWRQVGPHSFPVLHGRIIFFFVTTTETMETIYQCDVLYFQGCCATVI